LNPLQLKLERILEKRIFQLQQMVTSHAKVNMPIKNKLVELSRILAQTGHEYSARSWYFTMNIKRHLLTLQKLKKIRKKLPEGSFYNHIENEVFESFSESEWSHEFLNHPSEHLLDRSLYVLDKSLGDLILFAQRNVIASKNMSSKGLPLLEMGEIKLKSKIIESPSFYVSCFDYHLKVFGVPKIEHPRQKKRIHHALACLQKYAPKSFERVKKLTHTLVAVKDAGIVSYSSQDLPGFSTINLWHRDDIDLLDDLVHETGHHHLNLILNQKNLIREDDECIFYSPWRKTPRPIRGIYHGYFTFFWAMALFSELLKNKIPKGEKKIRRRYQEEFEMLKSCHPDLKKAYEMEKITKLGYSIVKDLMFLMKQEEKNFKLL